MTVWVVDLEAVETRYTGQWKTHVPDLIRRHGHDVQVISGLEDIPRATTPGAFLNFGGTNIYKASQVEKMGRLFCESKVKAGDHFLFTDAWHPGVINLKYMSELLGIPVTTHGLWHAGSYDPQDFLGRLVGDEPWVRHAEKSFFHSFDHNYFATEFHIKLFFDELLNDGSAGSDPRDRYPRGKIIRTGWPFENLQAAIQQDSKDQTRRDLILFPHRIAPEKQVEIFDDLARHMPEYEFVVCQRQDLTKAEYHRLLGQAKLVFSANLQETLGISVYEALCAGAMSLVPDRLSYREQYAVPFAYPSEFTESWSSYCLNKQRLIDTIRNLMESFDHPNMQEQITCYQKHLQSEYFSAKVLVDNLRT